ncbi:MAG: hypothetical protein M3N14_02705 [Bacteroidota bacterium]|nr:hypothetical protein [Bacteroidota bacterium]
MRLILIHHIAFTSMHLPKQHYRSHWNDHHNCHLNGLAIMFDIIALRDVNITVSGGGGNT